MKSEERGEEKMKEKVKRDQSRADKQVWLMAMGAGRGGGKAGQRRRDSSPPRDQTLLNSHH